MRMLADSPAQPIAFTRNAREGRSPTRSCSATSAVRWIR